MFFDLGVCDEHATPDGFLPNEDSWKRLDDAMEGAGRVKGDRSTFRLDYVGFDEIDPTARELLGATPTSH